MKELAHYGKHDEIKPGEIFIGYFSQYFFEEFISWATKRIGEIRYVSNDQDVRYPVFVSIKEAKMNGWMIVSRQYCG